MVVAGSVVTPEMNHAPPASTAKDIDLMVLGVRQHENACFWSRSPSGYLRPGNHSFKPCQLIHGVWYDQNSDNYG